MVIGVIWGKHYAPFDLGRSIRTRHSSCYGMDHPPSKHVKHYRPPLIYLLLERRIRSQEWIQVLQFIKFLNAEVSHSRQKYSLTGSRLSYSFLFLSLSFTFTPMHFVVEAWRHKVSDFSLSEWSVRTMDTNIEFSLTTL